MAAVDRRGGPGSLGTSGKGRPDARVTAPCFLPLASGPGGDTRCVGSQFPSSLWPVVSDPVTTLSDSVTMSETQTSYFLTLF